MRLTTQERRVVTFLVITLFVSGGIRLVQSYRSVPTAQQQFTDSLLVARATQVDSLVKTHQAPTSKTPALAPMVNQRVSLQLNINTADRESLMELPRIGPAMSKRIIAHREKNGYFKSFEDLLKVKGIGPATIQKLKPFIYF